MEQRKILENLVRKEVTMTIHKAIVPTGAKLKPAFLWNYHLVLSIEGFVNVFDYFTASEGCHFRLFLKQVGRQY